MNCALNVDLGLDIIHQDGISDKSCGCCTYIAYLWRWDHRASTRCATPLRAEWVGSLELVGSIIQILIRIRTNYIARASKYWGLSLRRPKGKVWVEVRAMTRKGRVGRYGRRNFSRRSGRKDTLATSLLAIQTTRSCFIALKINYWYHCKLPWYVSFCKSCSPFGSVWCYNQWDISIADRVKSAEWLLTLCGGVSPLSRPSSRSVI